MNGATPGASAHVVDLLPAYINGTLTEQDVQRVDDHLALCSLCRDELAVWQTLGDATRFSFDPASAEQGIFSSAPPASTLLAGVFARLDREAEAATLAWHGAAMTRSPLRWGAGVLRLIGSQVRLVPWGIWLAGTLATLFCLLPLVRPEFFAFHHISQQIAIIQSFVAPVAMALSLPFIYGPENDVGLEITLSTPVSPRRILLSRLLLVLVYNFALALFVTLVAVALHGGDLALLVSFWAGPMLLLSGLSLALSIGIGAVIGAGVTGGLWLIHVFISSISSQSGPVLLVLEPLSAIWQTTPMMLLLACLLFALAVVYVPRCVPQVGVESA
jgi:hypothetical protein